MLIDFNDDISISYGSRFLLEKYYHYEEFYSSMVTVTCVVLHVISF